MRRRQLAQLPPPTGPAYPWPAPRNRLRRMAGPASLVLSGVVTGSAGMFLLDRLVHPFDRLDLDPILWRVLGR